MSVPGNSQAEIWLPARFNRVKINGVSVTPIRKTPFVGSTRKVYPEISTCSDHDKLIV